MIKRIFYKNDFDQDKTIVNCNCFECMYFKKCITTMYDTIPDTMKYVQNCKNYLSNDDNIKDKIIKGGIYYDEFGNLLFNNNFRIDLNKIKRFYVVTLNNRCQFKGWHGHKKEEKFCLCLTGIVKVGITKIDDFNNPSQELIPEWYILKEDDCEILHIPNGCANGLMKLSKDKNACRILFFSTMSISESGEDDYRYDKGLWIKINKYMF